MVVRSDGRSLDAVRSRNGGMIDDEWGICMTESSSFNLWLWIT